MSEQQAKRLKKLPAVCVLCGPSFLEPMDSIDPAIRPLLDGKVELLDYNQALERASTAPVEGILLLPHPPVTGELLDRLAPSGGLKVVSNYGVGVDHVNLADCKKRGIPVGHTPKVLNDAVADFAFGLLLAVSRKIIPADRYARSDAYVKYEHMVLLGGDVSGSTLGIVGMGRIGLEIARRAVGFKMKVSDKPRAPKAAQDTWLQRALFSYYTK